VPVLMPLDIVLPNFRVISDAATLKPSRYIHI